MTVAQLTARSTSYDRRPRFESSHRQHFSTIIYRELFLEKTKLRKRGHGPLLNINFGAELSFNNYKLRRFARKFIKKFFNTPFPTSFPLEYRQFQN